MAQDVKVSGILGPETLAVTQPVDVRRANEAARSFARTVGFGATEADEIALAVTELASNLIKHASGGSIKFTSLESGERNGIQIESEDSGPGIADVELAVTDGYSTAGSLGTGLGAINRLMDSLEFEARSKGVRIVCQRFIRPKSSPFGVRWLEFGSATRACRMLPENGDAVVFKEWDGKALAGVIDGLGHGQFAQRASHAARQYVEQHFDQPLESLFRGVSRACRATRGVVMTLGRFEMAKQKVSLAGIGNVDARIIGQVHGHSVLRRGVLGLNAPQPVVSEHDWTPESVLIINSDGLRSRWSWEEFQDVAHERPGVIARRMLQKLGKMEDDATVVVVKNAKS